MRSLRDDEADFFIRADSRSVCGIDTQDNLANPTVRMQPFSAGRKHFSGNSASTSVRVSDQHTHYGVAQTRVDWFVLDVSDMATRLTIKDSEEPDVISIEAGAYITAQISQALHLGRRRDVPRGDIIREPV